MFTQNQIEEIRLKLAESGYKDSQFDLVEGVDGEDSIVILKNNKNVRIKVSDLLKAVTPEVPEDNSIVHIHNCYAGLTEDEFYKLKQALSNGTYVMFTINKGEQVIAQRLISYTVTDTGSNTSTISLSLETTLDNKVEIHNITYDIDDVGQVNTIVDLINQWELPEHSEISLFNFSDSDFSYEDVENNLDKELGDKLFEACKYKRAIVTIGSNIAYYGVYGSTINITAPAMMSTSGGTAFPRYSIIKNGNDGYTAKIEGGTSVFYYSDWTKYYTLPISIKTSETDSVITGSLESDFSNWYSEMANPMISFALNLKDESLNTVGTLYSKSVISNEDSTYTITFENNNNEYILNVDWDGNYTITIIPKKYIIPSYLSVLEDEEPDKQDNVYTFVNKTIEQGKSVYIKYAPGTPSVELTHTSYTKAENNSIILTFIHCLTAGSSIYEVTISADDNISATKYNI